MSKNMTHSCFHLKKISPSQCWKPRNFVFTIETKMCVRILANPVPSFSTMFFSFVAADSPMAQYVFFICFKRFTIFFSNTFFPCLNMFLIFFNRSCHQIRKQQPELCWSRPLGSAASNTVQSVDEFQQFWYFVVLMDSKPLMESTQPKLGNQQQRLTNSWEINTRGWQTRGESTPILEIRKQQPELCWNCPLGLASSNKVQGVDEFQLKQFVLLIS